jgi:hypothetical protein
LTDKYSGYDIDDDNDKVWEFKEKFAYAFLLTYSSQMIELANKMKKIKYYVDVLEGWKKEEWFRIKKTAYDISTLDKKYFNGLSKATLPQAKKFYKEAKLQYDTLFNVITETYEIHGKKDDGTEYDPKEYLTEIEI